MKYILGAAGMLFVSSCGSDFLDKVPEGSYVEDNYYASDDAVAAATGPLYNRAWFDFNQRSINPMGSARANDVYSPYNFKSFTLFTVDALDSDLSSAWTGIFSVVTMANAALENIETKCLPEVSEKARLQGKAEARLMRACAYYYAVHIWGSVILFENNKDVVDHPVRPRHYEEDVFEFIIRDLEFAAKYLPETPAATGRATCWSAKAMLAKTYLARSGWGKSTRDQEDLDKCKELCLDVIENSGSVLMENYHDLFKYRHNNNIECLLALQWYASADGPWYVKNALLSDLCADSKMIGGFGAWSALRAGADMLMQYRYKNQVTGKYEWEEIRRDATFCTPGAHYDYICIADGGYTYDGEEAIIKKGVPGGPDDDNDGFVSDMNSPLNTYIVRLADIYLTYTEACLGNNASVSGDDIRYFNAVRRRAGIKEATSVTLDDLIREHRVEFSMEYQNWYYLVDLYKWQPEKMLAYFNNQYRGYTYEKIEIGPKQEISFVTKPENSWQTYEETEFGKLVVPEVIANVTDNNMFFPYPESDVIQNPLLKAEPEHYNFQN
ncbi:RagB/SusD family nutrient uptake outer membrane protein [Duncaniella freteri]|uniref:RagB/SusD family nutrient uptake outer membrane protein n=1 Tax=Duncaniella freteri TaxID=2530391 RepID=UPI0025766656|nr:RagB/SusD family nutrient uptake outer membrane protein [Duncaniella freteri]